MSLNDRAEEILETLYLELEEQKKALTDASLLKDDEIVKELLNSGFVEVDNNQIKLTAKGREEGWSCVRRHRLAERLLVDILDFKKKLVHETSCKFEHLLHKGLDDNICILLGHPRRCPHGKPIPEGRCCRKAKTRPEKLVMPLSELGPNRKARVSYVETRDESALKKIIAIGVLPKTEIVLIQKFPSFVFKMGRRQFAVDKELASHIFVRPI